MKKSAVLTALLTLVMIAAPSAQAEDAAKPTITHSSTTSTTPVPPIKLDPCGGC